MISWTAPLLALLSWIAGAQKLLRCLLSAALSPADLVASRWCTSVPPLYLPSLLLWLESMRPAQLELVAETRTWSPWICRSRVSKGGTTAETEWRQHQGLQFSSPATPAAAYKDAAAGCALHLGSHRQLVSSFLPALPNASEAYALLCFLAIAAATLQLDID